MESCKKLMCHIIISFNTKFRSQIVSRMPFKLSIFRHKVYDRYFFYIQTHRSPFPVGIEEINFITAISTFDIKNQFLKVDRMADGFTLYFPRYIQLIFFGQSIYAEIEFRPQNGQCINYDGVDGGTCCLATTKKKDSSN
jgi:hypothetical protein